jgi:putative transposase
MQRKVPLTEGETYHVFNRGAHKQPIFLADSDQWRFLILLYLANREKPIVMRDILSKYRGLPSVEVFKEPCDKSLVDVLAYCLMQNHFHLVLRQKSPKGITKFMGRVSTGYSMYFNLKHKHSGTVFQGPFKTSHIDSEPYFRYIFSYIHLNPLELIEPHWKERGITNPQNARDYMEGYAFSSYMDYFPISRPQKVLLCEDIPDFLKSQNDFETLLQWHTEGSPL